MATTVESATSPEFHSYSDRKTIAWGIALAVVLAAIIIFMMRLISNEHTPASATGRESTAVEKVEESGASENRMPDTIPPTRPTDSTQPSR
jgi:hypothetical protein